LRLPARPPARPPGGPCRGPDSGAARSDVRRNPGGTARKSAVDFLLSYRRDIEALPEFQIYTDFRVESLDAGDRAVFMTLLPLGAALFRRGGERRTVLGALKRRALAEIDAVLSCTRQ
ncbi:MAG: hypothetical protein LBK64_08220, partial [Spirochaetaceae bacterium]|nr:hypothetical protein [Spirochaetaceae bacterium]